MVALCHGGGATTAHSCAGCTTVALCCRAGAILALRPGGKGGKGHGGERDDEDWTTYRFPGKHVAVAWLCLWAIRPTATILRVFILVPGHQISRRCTVYGSGAFAPHRLHLWPREEPWTGGGRGGPGLTRWGGVGWGGVGWGGVGWGGVGWWEGRGGEGGDRLFPCCFLAAHPKCFTFD